jgi:hypothetical protein
MTDIVGDNLSSNRCSTMPYTLLKRAAQFFVPAPQWLCVVLIATSGAAARCEALPDSETAANTAATLRYAQLPELTGRELDRAINSRTVSIRSRRISQESWAILERIVAWNEDRRLLIHDCLIVGPVTLGAQSARPTFVPKLPASFLEHLPLRLQAVRVAGSFEIVDSMLQGPTTPIMTVSASARPRSEALFVVRNGSLVLEGNIFVTNPPFLERTAFFGRVRISENRLLQTYGVGQDELTLDRVLFTSLDSATLRSNRLPMRLSRAVVLSDVRAAAAEFAQALYISDTTFEGIVDMRRSTFRARASFSRVTFGSSAAFFDAHFVEDAVFDGATFKYDAGFDNARFDGNASFVTARIRGLLLVTNAAFAAKAIFVELRCGSAALINSSRFNGFVAFDYANLPVLTLSGSSFFDGVSFIGVGPVSTMDIGLVNVNFSSPVLGLSWTMHGAAIKRWLGNSRAAALENVSNESVEGIDRARAHSRARGLPFDEESFALNERLGHYVSTLDASADRDRLRSILKVLERNSSAIGLDADGTAAYLERKRLERADRNALARAAERAFLDWSCAYGTSPGRLPIWSLFLVCAFAMVYVRYDWIPDKVPWRDSTVPEHPRLISTESLETTTANGRLLRVLTRFALALLFSTQIFFGAGFVEWKAVVADDKTAVQLFESADLPSREQRRASAWLLHVTTTVEGVIGWTVLAAFAACLARVWIEG